MCEKYDPNIHQRRSIRLNGYDYSQEGWYYVTVCAFGHKCIFSKIVDGQIQLYKYGQIIDKCWKWLAERYDYVHLDRYVVMPNHLHGIIFLKGGSRTAPTIKNKSGSSLTAPTNTRKCKSLSSLVGAFKTISTKQINIIRNTPGKKLWQRNYYEHVIRDEDELNHIRQYIAENSLNWRTDEENPEVISNT
ncbi:MAG: transposase [Sedimentisphaerales bacterium]|nr:transposase [Sedimentisphaerales bacterium]